MNFKNLFVLLFVLLLPMEGSRGSATRAFGASRNDCLVSVSFFFPPPPLLFLCSFFCVFPFSVFLFSRGVHLFSSLLGWSSLFATLFLTPAGLPHSHCVPSFNVCVRVFLFLRVSFLCVLFYVSLFSPFFHDPSSPPLPSSGWA